MLQIAAQVRSGGQHELSTRRVIPSERGPLVARKRPTASHVRQPALVCLDGESPSADGPLLTRDEAAALRRSAAFTHVKLTEILTSYVRASAPENRGRDPLRAAGEGAAS